MLFQYKAGTLSAYLVNRPLLSSQTTFTEEKRYLFKGPIFKLSDRFKGLSDPVLCAPSYLLCKKTEIAQNRHKCGVATFHRGKRNYRVLPTLEEQWLVYCVPA